MTRTLTIEYGDDLLVSLGMSPAEFSREAAFLLAAKLYELGRLTSRQAAKLCGKERVELLLDLPRVHVAVSNLGADDADDEIAFARHG
jgi:predicted HTH domain antitoxin